MLTDDQRIDINARGTHRGHSGGRGMIRSHEQRARQAFGFHRNGPRIIVEMHRLGGGDLHRRRIYPLAFSTKSPDAAPVQAASSGEPARRNVNTGRPISLIGPIRSNARHSPTYIPLP